MKYTKKVFTEIEGIVYRSTEQLLGFAEAKGRAASELRYTVGDLRAHINRYVRDGTFGRRLMISYRLATDAGISVKWMDNVLKQLASETPSDLAAVAVVQNSILFALAQDARILAKTNFTSREDVDNMLVRMKGWFDVAIELAAGQRDNPGYAALISLAGSITRYLADVARPLPRMLAYELLPMPGLTLSQFIYSDGSRSEEIAAENKVVHPLFCPAHIKALSA
jgi:prophage DNA circulation protein